jgi:zinc transporter ZupT
MRYQLLTGLCGSILCLIVLQFQSNLIAQVWSNQIFLPILAGIFVYISTVHIIPEVMESNYGFKGTIFKVNAFIISGFIIFYLKNYE